MSPGHSTCKARVADRFPKYPSLCFAATTCEKQTYCGSTPIGVHELMIDRLRYWLLDRSRYTKRTVLILADLCLLTLALYVPLALRYGTLYYPVDPAQMILLALGPATTLICLWQTRIYRQATRFFGLSGIKRIGWSIVVSVPLWGTVVFLAGQNGVPRSVVIPYGVLALALLSGARFLASLLLEGTYAKAYVQPADKEPKATIIVGASAMGLSLLRAAERIGDRKVMALVDPSPTLWRQYLGNLRVHAPAELPHLIARHDVQEILVALPGSQDQDRRRILVDLERCPVQVKILPAYEDVSSGRVMLSDLRPLDVVDLLGRDPIAPNKDLLAERIIGRAILVTGAGGSIGSELVRQILAQKPRTIVLLDSSEAALYLIGTEIEERIAAKTDQVSRPKLKLVLGSVLNESLVATTISNERIDTIFHAAAYKHVPIVEENPIVGLENNVVGTYTVAACAARLGVDRMVLVSTDKAVRPTNVMGASKRFAELIIQAYASANESRTVFTMVRFGNVLDSSGSVVQRFRKQIVAGGPVTVTHREATRYFMSIPEAAALVIQAGAMATGGEVFVLDMGVPVKIDDLARRMIQLSGLSVRDDQNPRGNIEISYIGLRPGEKLYEELLIGAKTMETAHPRIQRSDEPFLELSALKTELSYLRAAITANDVAAVQALLVRNVEGYVPSQMMNEVSSTGATTPAHRSRALH